MSHADLSCAVCLSPLGTVRGASSGHPDPMGVVRESYVTPCNHWYALFVYAPRTTPHCLCCCVDAACSGCGMRTYAPYYLYTQAVVVALHGTAVGVAPSRRCSGAGRVRLSVAGGRCDVQVPQVLHPELPRV